MGATNDSSDTGHGFGTSSPQISLPKGGGAIRGIGEKFSTNSINGSGVVTLPLATSRGRGGFGANLSLSYDSSSGNGVFGLGWSLSLPSISRKTEKGLPRYWDLQNSDTFILSGAEDLVPEIRRDDDGTWVGAHPGFQRDSEELWVRDSSGRLVVHEDIIDGYQVRLYKPRIEGLFARIERWTKIDAPADVHWRSISRDNVLTIYGLDANSRIADPDDAGRVFSWLISEVRDDKGNAVIYRYKPEDGIGLVLDRPSERNRGSRNDARRATNRYPKRIYYGNRAPLLDDAGRRPHFLSKAQIEAEIANAGWMFEIVFDYGDHDATSPSPNDDKATDVNGALKYPWKARLDKFSSYRSGFEIRTTRLCRRIMMFHHFPDDVDVGLNCLVRSTDLAYSEDRKPTATSISAYAFLRHVKQSGFRRANGGYLSRSLPPVEFEYTEASVQEEVEQIDESSLENLPTGIDGKEYRWVDLHGEGIPGILTEQLGTWYYKRNLSPGARDPREHGKDAIVQFAPAEVVSLRPNLALADAEFVDLAGDGLPDIAILEGARAGFYEHNDADGWDFFTPFASRLNRNTRKTEVRFIDLDGDGRADVLITEDQALSWHESLGEDGFGPVHRIPLNFNDDDGPRVIFADDTQSIYLADLSGDGLSDILRIRNGDVCYWPNLGYGRFGAKITMDDPPYFDNPDQFEQRRVRLADIDGTGTTDIVYLHREGVRIYFNQSGNGWSKPHQIKLFPRFDNLVEIVPIDLLGNGTMCLVWSSIDADAPHQMRYVNLVGARKPHLLSKMTNNLGTETVIEYAPSTKFYLQDKRNGKPWITRLPFPVHVVERVTTVDYVGRSRFVTKYAYHHGFFDGVEREFRGFGLVEQWDTEEFSTSNNGFFEANISEDSHVAPVHTKTWFHTGVYLGRGRVSAYFAGLLDATDKGEYFREPGLTDDEACALLLHDTLLPSGLNSEEERQACRALKGAMLRQEIYADDAPAGATRFQVERASTPYSVVEQNFTVRCLQPCIATQPAVFFSHARETISYQYERNAADPRILHGFTLQVDSYGNILKRANIAYGRREVVRLANETEPQQNPALLFLDPDDRAKQTTPLLTYAESRFTNAIASSESYRTPAHAEEATFELTGYIGTGPGGRYQLSDLIEVDPLEVGQLRLKFDHEIADQAEIALGTCRRMIELVRTLYRRDDLTGLLPLGKLEPLAITGESYKLAFTSSMLATAFTRPTAGNGAESLIPTPATVLGGQSGSQGGYLESQSLKMIGAFPPTDPNNHWWIPSGRSYFTTNSADDLAVELAEARRHFFVPRRYRDPFGQDTLIYFDRSDLLPVETRDALGNRISVGVNDYRVLQPRLLIDPNRNRTEVSFDALGMVVGTALMGKPSPADEEGDSLNGFVADLTQAELDQFFAADPRAAAKILLKDATTRFVYDLERFVRTRKAHPADPNSWLPACAATLAREIHSSDPSGEDGRIGISLSYSDGFGREIQKKIRAEPGRLDINDPDAVVVDPRWVSSGWTIFNNKGKPVRQYQPFFTVSFGFEFGIANGVAAILFYDPADRVVATLHPNHSYEKVVFDPWQQSTYDVNDTCAPVGSQTGDPRDDPDIAGHVLRYFRTQDPNWQTWYVSRKDGARGAEERAAALRAAGHADTPTTAVFDPLGRPFLTITRNRVWCAGHPLDGAEDSVAIRVELDIKGNQLAVQDERKLPGNYLPAGAIEQRTVMRYVYDMIGNRVRQQSMEAGGRWTLHDAVGKPIRAWDNRGHDFSTTYDALRRPLSEAVKGNTSESDPRTLGGTRIVERVEYGESVPNAEALNLRTRIFRMYDSAGVSSNARLDENGTPIEAFDFKGNLLQSTRRFVTNYKSVPDWTLDVELSPEVFGSSTRYDALNRPIQSVLPHSNLSGHTNKFNVIQPVFNEANLLERLDVWLELAAEPALLLDAQSEPPSRVGVANIDYDARGQYLQIIYKNAVVTRYTYDPETLRLVHLYTRRGMAFSDDCVNPAPPPLTIPAPERPPPKLPCGIQNLHYTYDPAGNVIQIRDDAQQTIFFRNKRVEPTCDYTYDALYRLIQASGREHLGQIGPPTAHSWNDAGKMGVVSADLAGRFAPSDGAAMGRYLERYVYDAVGNLLQMQHLGLDPANPGWRRGYEYLDPSVIEDGSGGTSLKRSNRLSRTVLNPSGGGHVAEPYDHDVHGNIVRMPHLGAGGPARNLHWDYKDQLISADLGGGGSAFYLYDGSGQRVRRIWEKTPTLIEEHIYLGSAEIFRKHNGTIGHGTAVLERETLHVVDESRRVAIVETRTLDLAAADAAPRQLIRYQFGSHLGSSTLELDEQSRIISFEEYSPYGSTMYQAVRSNTETPKRYRFTGKERDEESGLYYHGARYYACWLGRWASTDPIGLSAGSSNLYVYCRGDPIARFDPNGQQDSPQPWLSGRYPVSQAPPPSSPPGTPASAGSPNILAQGPGITTDPLEAAARLHGATQGKIANLSQEILELGHNLQHQDGIIRGWEIDYLASYAGSPEPINERVAELDEFVDAGLAEYGADKDYHSTVLEQAIESGIITNEADQKRFLAIADAERQTERVKWAAWRAVKMAMALIPSGQGAGGALFARAPHSTTVALNLLNKATEAAKIEGKYINVIESMSKRAMEFQELVSGGIKAGTSFLRNSVKFDYVDVARKVLIDAKGPGYGNFVNKSGEFYKWFAGRTTLVDQATRQLAAAKGMAVEWQFAEPSALKATQKLLNNAGITGIKLVLH